MSSDGKKKKILVIDDEAPIAELIAEFCEILGFKTMVINSGKDVLETVKSFHPDLITLDLNMPDIPGAKVLAVLKKNSETEPIPVVIISAIAESNSTELNDERIKLSQAIMSKPIQIKKLKEKLSTFLKTEE